jgi:hypothetical protein
LIDIEKGKMKFRLGILLFSIVIFILTAVGLGIIYYRTPIISSFWLVFVYIVACVVVMPLAADFFVEGGRLSWTQFLSLTFGVIILSGTVTHSAWIIVTPRWAFSVSTDRSTYTLGEEVRITVSLKNMGFITHSFTSGADNPIVVKVAIRSFEREVISEYGYSPVWYSSFSRENTHFSVGPNQILERNFLWNQTDIYRPEREIPPAEYIIEAIIPGPNWEPELFWTKAYMNVTST